MKKLIRTGIALTLAILTLLTTTGAQAIKGASDCAYDYRETGEAVFLLDTDGRMLGALTPDEDMSTLRIQKCAKTSPMRIREAQCLRRHNWARVELDENLRVVAGGTSLTVTVLLYSAEEVAAIIGQPVTVAAVIDSTIYSPNLCSPAPKAAHMFIPAKSRDKEVGRVYFANGAALAIYSGDFDGDGALDLGFRALILSVSEEETCATCHQKECTCKSCSCQVCKDKGCACQKTCTKKTTKTTTKTETTCQPCVKVTTTKLTLQVAFSLTTIKFGCCK